MTTSVRAWWRGWLVSDSIGCASTRNMAGIRVPRSSTRRGAFHPGLGELVVRVATCDFVAIGAALDAGASAVIVPQIESAAQAERAVAATFYPPVGERSMGQLSRIWGGSTLTAEEANRSTTCAVMIECCCPYKRGGDRGGSRS